MSFGWQWLANFSAA